MAVATALRGCDFKVEGWNGPVPQIKGIFIKSFVTKAAALLLKEGLTSFKKAMDYTETGGALVMGVDAPVIKAHGSSNAKAFFNAVRQAKRFAETDVIGELRKTFVKSEDWSRGVRAAERRCPARDAENV